MFNVNLGEWKIALVRWASSSSPEVWMPSVDFLIHKHHLSEEQIASIPRSGPKNRLLKGDVLEFLANPEGIQSFKSIPHTYYSTNVILSLPASQDGLRSGLNLSDLIARMTTKAIELVPEVHQPGDKELSSLNLRVIRGSNYGSSLPRMVKNFQEMNAKKLSNALQNAPLVDSSLPILSPYFTLLDYSQVSSPIDIPEPYLKSSESGILLVQPLTSRSSSSGKKDDDIVDSLIGNSPSLSVCHEKPGKETNVDVEPKKDLLDLLLTSTSFQRITTTALQLRLDLIANGNRVSSKTALKFLNTWKDLASNPKKWQG